MDALSLIKENLDVDFILKYYDFDKMKPDGGYIRSCCKIHGGNNPTGFVINKENGVYYCHTGGCGGGDIFTLVQKLDGLSFQDSVRKVAELLGIDIDNLEIVERKASYMKEVKNFIDMMRARTKKKSSVEYTINAELRDVTKFRNFSVDTLKHFGLKYVEKIYLVKRDGEPYTLRNRLLFPIYSNHTLVGISLRRIKASDNPKWLHQPVNIDTRELLYNLDATHGLDCITVVEGIPDVWAYHEIGVTAVCTFGAHLTDEQYRMLLRTGADLVWSYDGDEAGRIATDNATKRFKHKANNYIIEFADGEDPASIPREELVKRYDSKRRI